MIDDDDDILQSLKNIIRPTKFSLKTTTSPFEGIALCEKFKFDLLITDIKMDELNGADLIKKIRGINNELKIIIVSAYCTMEMMESLLNYNIYNIQQKPLNIKYFINTLFEIEKIMDNKK
jgi:DNA-binding NtrC family response regulator